MAYKDLRDFLDVLKTNNQLLEVDRHVDLKLEVAKALRKSAAIEGPAILFKDNGTPYQLVGGLYNSRAKALLAFQATEATLFDQVTKGLANPIAPVVITNAPAQENVINAADVDLSQIPIPLYSPDDGGPYITSAISISKDPETGVPDMGNYRFEYIDSKTLSFLAQPNHRLGLNIAKAIKLGQKTFSIALIIGIDPVTAFACQFQMPDDTNDFNTAGGLRGAAVELVQCKTIDLQVPAHAEFVLELEIDLSKTVFEGPLGEYTGYYTAGSLKPTATVKAITHRNQPYFQALLTGVPPTENHILKQIPFEASFYTTMHQAFPTISRVAIPPSGGVSFYVIIAMEPRFAGEAQQAILAAMSSNVRPKMVVVVNDDIDIRNPDEVEWAMSFRMQPHEDVTIINHLPAGPLDPSISDSVPLASRVSSSIGIDATYPFGSKVDDGDPKDANSGSSATSLNFKVATVPGWQDYHFPELDKS